LFDIIKIIVLVVITIFNTACITPIEFDGDSPDTFLKRRDIINIPYTLSDSGLIEVNVQLDEGRSVPMIIDTGATQTSIYGHLQRRLNLEPTGKTVQIHGMVESGFRSELTLPYMGLGGHKIKNTTVALLSDIPQNENGASKIGGLIGLDVLSKFFIYFDRETEILSLIPTRYKMLTMPPSWLRIPLGGNPFQEDEHKLKYLEIRVSGQLVPALFDTGAEINVINWTAVKNPRVRALRRRLRGDWELKGAIGQFDPKAKIQLLNIRSGQRFWNSRDFIMLDLESLNVLGVMDQSFIIAGANMFTRDTFWLDLNAGEIIVKPNSDNRQRPAFGGVYKIIVDDEL